MSKDTVQLTVEDPETSQRIVKTPDCCGGKAHIRSTHITVWSLIHARRMGFSQLELLKRFVEPITMADLEAAWRYYESHREEIDAEIQQNTRIIG